MSFEIDWPEYHYQGMGCGLEDRSITDRYEACEYGWNEAIERCASEVVEPLVTRIEELEDMLSSVLNDSGFKNLDDELQEKIWEKM